MSLIETVSPEKATGIVADVYREVAKIVGHVPNGMQLYSSSPALLAQYWQQLGYYLPHSTLSQPLLATIRLLVSEAYNCEYCIGMNAGMLINMFGFTPDQVTAIRRDPESAPFNTKDKAMLRFVLKTVIHRQQATRAEIDSLASQGWSHADVLDAVSHGARSLSSDVVLNAFAVENDFAA